MKLSKYIIVIVPNKSYNHWFGLPYTNYIWYETGEIITGEQRLNSIVKLFKSTEKGKEILRNKGFANDFKVRKAIKCEYLKPNTGIRYNTIGKWWIFLLIKQLN